MRKLRLFGTALFTAICALALVSVAVAREDGNGSRFRTTLIGYQEVPAISTLATGSLTLNLKSNPDRIEYTLTYSALDNKWPTWTGIRSSRARKHWACGPLVQITGMQQLLQYWAGVRFIV